MGKSRQAPFQGKVKASLIPLTAAVVSLFSIILCYVLSQLKNEEPPFPGASITETSNHYWQYIVFRIAEEGSAVFIAITWLIEYAWLNQKARSSGVYLWFTNLQLGLGIVSSILFVLSTASIDTGKMNMEFHITCALGFFLTTIATFVLNFLNYVQLKCSKEAAIEDNSYYIKLAVNVLIGVLISQNNKGIENYVNIEEYSIVFLIMVYLCSFAIDWQGYYLQFGINQNSFISLDKGEEILTNDSSFGLNNQETYFMGNSQLLTMPMQLNENIQPMMVQMPAYIQYQQFQ